MVNYYKGRFNAFSVASQLPPEVLGAIFLEVSFSQSGKQTHIQWIRSVSHVCAYWRKVALSTADLWSNIPLDNKLWATEMLSRSNNRPLTISCHETLNPYEVLRTVKCHAVLEEIMRLHLRRIKSLTLDSHIHDEDDFFAPSHRTNFSTFLELLKQPAPMLENLKIYVRQNSSRYIQYPVKLPQLRHLTMDGYAVTWTASSFENLRSLRIYGLPEAMKPTIHQLLHVFRRTPLLERFSLKSIKQSSKNGGLPSQYKPVSLQYLARMELSCILPDCIDLLDRLDLSGRKVNEIILNITTPQSSHVHLVRDLARKIESKCDGRVQKLVFDHVLRFITSGDSCLHSCTVEVTFTAQYRGAFWQSLNLDQLSMLNSWYDFGSAENWSIFGSLPNLKTIRISDSDEGRLLEALVRETIIGPHTPSLAFPALKHLTILSWKILRHESDRRQEVVDQMVSCLKLRHSMGLTLECLCLEDCFEYDDDEDYESAILARLDVE